MKQLRIVTFVCFATIVLTACATQPHVVAEALPGFLPGLLHGITMPFEFFGSFFGETRIYAFPNSGRPYDLGYMIGSAMLGVALYSAIW